MSRARFKAYNRGGSLNTQGSSIRNVANAYVGAWHTETHFSSTLTDDQKAAKYKDKCDWEQSLGCQCASSLPIINRIKLNGKWIGYCRKCKPKGFTA